MSDKLKGFEHFDLLFPSNYLKAGDLRGKEVTVIIDEIEPRHELRGVGGKKDTKPLLHLRAPNGRKLDRGFLMNKTNGRRIMALYGPELKNWIGKPITLRAEPEAKSDSGEAIRVKQEMPKLKANGNGKQPQPEPEEQRHDPDTGEVVATSSENYDYGPPPLDEAENAQ